MELICLGSSSKGNCYILHSTSSDLIIECGVGFADIKAALDWKISNIAGCVVSHEHKDHSRSVAELLRNGVKVYALAEVFNCHKVSDNPFCKTIKPGHGYKVGDFKVFAFAVSHDVPCLGFVVEHHEMGKLLFVTDTMMFEYRIDGLNHIMIEANYCDDVLQENIDNGYMPKSMRPRLLGSHMELHTTADIVKTTDLSTVNEIILLHLSSRNSDRATICRTIREVSGKPVYVAENGLKLNLNIEPY